MPLSVLHVIIQQHLRIWPFSHLIRSITMSVFTRQPQLRAVAQTGVDESGICKLENQNNELKGTKIFRRAELMIIPCGFVTIWDPFHITFLFFFI